jgi:hypothetical protein
MNELSKIDKSNLIAKAIPAPNFQKAQFTLIGSAPYVGAKFTQKAKNQIREKMLAGSTSRKGQKREPRNFESDYQQAMHVSRDGWTGIPASCIRLACISACRLVGFKMTLAKLSVFVQADGYDADEGTPLLKIVGEPRMHEAHVRNATGVVDLRVRPMWEKWSISPTISWDADQFTAGDIVNLLERAGRQVGIGEGRPDGKSSAGQGWGTFYMSDDPVVVEIV